MIIAAHPDDEVLGAGGTLMRHAEEGDDVYCLILGTGALSREKAGSKDVEALDSAAKESAKILGFRDIWFSRFPDNRFDSVDLLQIIKEVEKHVEKTKPEIVYTHHGGDLNIDHKLTFDAVLTACRPIKGCSVRKILTFETLSSTEWGNQAEKPFLPNTYLDITGTIEKKVEAIKCYSSELRDYPHPRSEEAIRALARKRGSEAGLESAEAFCLVREVDR